MGLAPVAYSLWQYFLNYDPAGPLWPNRDRFVLSAGHASMLLYSILHLVGVKEVDTNGQVQKELSISMEQIKRFRVLGTFWEPGGDELTQTMKLRRKPIAAKYAAEIDGLYAATPGPAVHEPAAEPAA